MVLGDSIVHLDGHHHAKEKDSALMARGRALRLLCMELDKMDFSALVTVMYQKNVPVDMKNTAISNATQLRDHYFKFDFLTGYQYSESDIMVAMADWMKRPIICVVKTKDQTPDVTRTEKPTETISFQTLGPKNNKTPYLVHLEGEHFRAIELQDSFDKVLPSSTVSSTKQKQVRTGSV